GGFRNLAGKLFDSDARIVRYCGEPPVEEEAKEVWASTCRQKLWSIFERALKRHYPHAGQESLAVYCLEYDCDAPEGREVAYYRSHLHNLELARESYLVEQAEHIPSPPPRSV